MMKDTVFTVKVEADLRAAFVAEAAAMHRPAAQLIRDYMRTFIEQRRAEREHDTWFRDQVEAGVRQAADSGVERIPNERMKADWQQKRTALMTKAKTKG
jgi:hypothetical protein